MRRKLLRAAVAGVMGVSTAIGVSIATAPAASAHGCGTANHWDYYPPHNHYHWNTYRGHHYHAPYYYHVWVDEALGRQYDSGPCH